MRTLLAAAVTILIPSVAGVLGPLDAPFPAVFQLSSLSAANGGNGSLGFVIEGDAQDQRIGQDVANAGDINNDGIDDVIIGSGFDSSIASICVVFGRNTAGANPFPATLLPASLTGTNGFRFTGIPDGYAYEGGTTVSSAGDLNNDTIDDVIIGVPGAGEVMPVRSGRVYVFFGRNTSVAGPFGSTVSLAALNGADGFVREGIFSSNSGCSVATLGDVNGNGIDDVLIGAEASSQPDPANSFAGSSVLLFGQSTPFAATGNLSAITTGFYGVDAGDNSGCSVAGAGDINHDGVADMVLGAYKADSFDGESYVVFGRPAGFGPLASPLAALNGTTGFRMDGVNRSGVGVSTAGDLNHDGIDDVAIASETGAWVVFGRNTAVNGEFPASIDLTQLNGADGFSLGGASTFPYYCGRIINTAGDINDDGIDDLIIGAMLASPGGRVSAGECFVLYGRNVAVQGSFPASIALASLNGLNGFRLEGDAAGDRAGVSVSSAGDINGDGVSDLLIGAVLASPGGRTRAGEAYIVFGRHAPPPCASDANGDNLVNGLDLSVLLGQFGQSVTPGTGADLNGDGIVNGADLSALLGQFGSAC